MKPIHLIVLVAALISSSVKANPIETSFSSALKSFTTRDGKTSADSPELPSINQTLLREFITQFLRALRNTLAESNSADAATNKLEQRQGSGTSRFQFPEHEQVKQSSSLSLAPKLSRGVNMAKIEKVGKPTNNFQSTRVELVRKGRADGNSAEAPPRIGKPSTIMSQPLRIIDGPRDGKRGRSLKEIDVQGVKIIVGERVPDSPEDKFFTWRNARVIKGTLVPNNNERTVKSQSSTVVL